MTDGALSDELLQMIFIQCVVDHQTSPHFAIRDVPNWVNVSHVCRRWRSAALDCSALWSYHFVTSLRWSEELLARSTPRPLKICINFGLQKRRSTWLSLTKNLMRHAEHVQEFQLQFPDVFSGHTQICSALSSRAPRLQTLKISAGSSFQLPFVLFDGDTPALRTLELSPCPVPWYSFNLAALTTLSLHGVHDQFQQGMEEFLGTLSQMQDLTHLYLEDALASATGVLSRVHAFQIVYPKRLRRLLIDAPLSTVIVFLSCVDIPVETEVRLGCHAEGNPSPHDYIQLCSVLARRISTTGEHALSSPTVHSLTIESLKWRGGTKMSFSGAEHDFHSFDTISGEAWNLNVPLMIFVDLDLSTSDGDILSNICCSIPFADLQSIHIIRPPSSSFWRRLLGHFEELQYLKLSNGPMPDLVPALSPARADQAPVRVLAPALKKLVLFDILFSATPRESDTLHPRPTVDVDGDVEPLSAALSSREGSRGELTLTKCVVNKHDYDMFGKWEGGDFHVVGRVTRPRAGSRRRTSI
ncbi:hypothetical protein OG21DRAFT_1483910 [Imleria badia]|nr:hypothetical protein OG21DRAFT_1483910 [Imleria badia]